VVVVIPIAIVAIPVMMHMSPIEGSDMDPSMVWIAARDAVIGLLDAVYDHPSDGRAPRNPDPRVTSNSTITGGRV
jgi:hypothetical protein